MRNVFPPWIFESQGGVRAVIDIAIVTAIEESRPDFSQIALSDWLTAQHTKRLGAGCPAIHQDKFHVAPPEAKQNMVPRRDMIDDRCRAPSRDLEWSPLATEVFQLLVIQLRS
jgi:hypothetical protein